MYVRAGLSELDHTSSCESRVMRTGPYQQLNQTLPEIRGVMSSLQLKYPNLTVLDSGYKQKLNRAKGQCSVRLMTLLHWEAQLTVLSDNLRTRTMAAAFGATMPRYGRLSVPVMYPSSLPLYCLFIRKTPCLQLFKSRQAIATTFSMFFWSMWIWGR